MSSGRTKRKKKENSLPDINIREDELPQRYHDRIICTEFEEAEKQLFERAFFLLVDDKYEVLSTEDIIFYSHFAQLRLVLDARFGLAIQNHPLTKELFGNPQDLHRWLSSNPLIMEDAPNWYELYCEWVMTIPKELLSFQPCEKDEDVHLHHLLLDYAVTRDLSYPREEGIGWMPLPNASDYGFSFKIDSASNQSTLDITNFHLSDNSLVNEGEADLRLWIPTLVRLQIRYAYVKNQETKITHHINIWKNTDRSGRFIARKFGDDMIRKPSNPKAQFALKKPVVRHSVTFKEIFCEKPIAWLAFAEIVYLRTKENPASANNIFRNLQEKVELEEGDLVYYVVGDYHPGSGGRTAAYFGWF